MGTDDLSLFFALIAAFAIAASFRVGTGMFARTAAVGICLDVDAFQIAQKLVVLRTFRRAARAETSLFRTAFRIAVAAVFAVCQGIITGAVAAQLCAAVNFTAAVDAYLACVTGFSAVSAVVVVAVDVDAGAAAFLFSMTAFFIRKVHALAVDAYLIGFARMIAVAAVLVLAAAGVATMWMAVFADVGVTVLAVLNAMRAQ